MRTREEQIAAIEEFCGELGISNDSPDMETIEQWLIEAERRAEQRVRAEIGRDSERLDWLNKDFFENGAVLFTGRYENMGTLDWKAIGVAHEDYRELGYKHTIRDAIDAAMEVE